VVNTLYIWNKPRHCLFLICCIYMYIIIISHARVHTQSPHICCIETMAQYVLTRPNKYFHSHLQYGSTPIFVASRNGHIQVVKILLDNGANPNIQKEVNICSLQYSFTPWQRIFCRKEFLMILYNFQEHVAFFSVPGWS
jgi:hypothetical protein